MKRILWHEKVLRDDDDGTDFRGVRRRLGVARGGEEEDDDDGLGK